MIWLLGVAGYAIAIAALTWLLRRLRPAWSRERIVTAASAPGPVLVVLAVVWAIVRLGPAPAGETDATGMAMMVYMVGGGFGVAVLAAVGLAASLLAWRFPR